MDKNIKKRTARMKRKYRVRKTLSGNADRPRLTVYRSLRHIYAQIIVDTEGKTLCQASTLEAEVQKKLKGTSNADAAKKVGELVAERALAANVKEVVFDRNGFLYHGRVKALAEGARGKGLVF
ncbi:MAG: 50S ribosomal protein L18 [Deltaproteobacteria bacterium]|nr:50S ribosomal protein L18 [Deltaproteobacteria bacterium]